MKMTFLMTEILIVKVMKILNLNTHRNIIKMMKVIEAIMILIKNNSKIQIYYRDLNKLKAVKIQVIKVKMKFYLL